MIALLIYLGVIGLVAYLITTFIPMAPPIKNIIYVVAALMCILLVLHAFGLLSGPLPRLG